jgi:ArsR family transcriptional regulator
VLKAADLVGTERQGTTIIYRLNMSVLEEALAAMLDIAGMRGAKPEEK